MYEFCKEKLDVDELPGAERLESAVRTFMNYSILHYSFEERWSKLTKDVLFLNAKGSRWDNGRQRRPWYRDSARKSVLGTENDDCTV